MKSFSEWMESAEHSLEDMHKMAKEAGVELITKFNGSVRHFTLKKDGEILLSGDDASSIINYLQKIKKVG